MTTNIEPRLRDPDGYEAREAARKKAAANIDPVTAEIWWRHARTETEWPGDDDLVFPATNGAPLRRPGRT